MSKHGKHLQNLVQSLKERAHDIKFLDQILTRAITVPITDPIPTPTWNCLVRAYSKSPKPVKAIFTYSHFTKHSSSKPPDNYTFPALLKACSRLHYLPLGKQVHAHVIKFGLDPDIFVQNSLVHFYGSLLQVADARSLFDAMPQRDVASWNSLMGVYACISDRGSWTEVTVLFKKLMSECIKPDNITLVIVLSACARASSEELECGRAVHAFAIKLGFGCFLNLNNALLDMYTKWQHVEAATRVFDEMGSSRDVVSYTILIDGFVEIGLVDLARDVFDRIVDKDVVLWNLMIHGYVKAKHPNHALELFKRMDNEEVMPDERTMVSVVAACASLSDLQCGRLVHRLINRKGLRQDVFLKTALVDMYSKCGSVEEALVIFYKMNYKDVFAWTAVIEGLANNGYGLEALSMFNKMDGQGIQPNEATFNSVLTACSRCALVEEGCQLFKNMVHVYRLRPEIEHVGCFINLLSRAGLLNQAEEFIKLLLPEERLIAYKTLLSACINYSEFDLGEKVANQMMKLSSDCHETHILLSNFYALAGQWTQVAKARRIMKEFSTRRKAGTSSV